MEIISFYSIKGGTGKSTLTILTINALTASGFKCLAIDTDQANHSMSFYYNSNIDFQDIKNKNIFKVFTGESIQDNIININDNLDLIHADVRLSDFRSIDSFNRLKKQLENLTGYDYIIIDTPPTYDNIIINILYASQYLIIPVIPDIFNYQSLKYLFEKLIELDLNNLDISVILNQYETSRSTNNKLYSIQIIKLFKGNADFSPFLSTSISKSNNIKKYINDHNFKINESKNTIKQLREIKDFIENTFSVNLKLNNKGI